MFRSFGCMSELRKLQRNLELSGAQLEEIQRQKLRALLRHAYENVPYYRNLFVSAGAVPEDIHGVEDLPKIPTTSKFKLQSLGPEEIPARGIDPRECISDVTSGSTGIPLQVRFTRTDYDFRSLFFLRTFMETGYRLTQRQAVVCDTRFVSNRTYWFQRMGIFRKLYIPVQIDLAEQVKMLEHYQPHYIHGYAVSLGLIANEMLGQGKLDVAPKMVCTGAELVTGNIRNAINKAFGVSMVDTYASIESGLIAWECHKHMGYHVNIDGIVLELLNDGRPAKPGECGKVVITNLHSYAMPIIRYELGDVCIPSEESCSCGISLPLIGIVQGRIDDLVYTPSGKVVSPNSITNTMEAVEGIKEFRVIQKNKEELLIQIVPGSCYSVATSTDAVRKMNELTGGEMKIAVENVDRIPRENTGKIRSVISHAAKNGSLQS
jgi:phenylacetate-CoA ligase